MVSDGVDMFLFFAQVFGRVWSVSLDSVRMSSGRGPFTERAGQMTEA